MQLNIRVRKLMVDEATRVLVARRLRFALSRFGERIVKATVKLEDVNGPRGGVDKRCHVTVILRPTGMILIEDHDADLRTAVNRAADRASRAVHRELKLRQDAKRLSSL